MVAKVRTSTSSKASKSPSKVVKDTLNKNVSESLVKKAVAALLKHHEKTAADSRSLLGTDAAIQVQFGLEIAPIRPSPKPMRIMIPNPIHKVNDTDDDTGLEEPEVCLIVKEESKEWVQALIAKFPEQMGCVKKVLGLQSLRTKHSEFKQRRELLHKYTVFMADDRILPMLTKALGKDFLKVKKQPIPIALTRKESLPFAILKALSATHMVLSEGTCVTVRAGNTGMPADKLAANVAAICAAASEKVPRKWANVCSIAIKTPNSVSLPIYNKTPEELTEIAKMAGLKSVWKETTAADDAGKEKEDKEDKVVTKEKKRKAEKLAAKSPLVKALKKQKQKEAKDEEEEKEKAAAAKQAKKERKIEAEERSSKKAKKSKASTEPASVEKKRRKSDASDVAEKTPKKSAEKAPKKSAEKKSAEKPAKKNEAFIAAKKFKGSKKGYVFQMGSSGVGYYQNVKPVIDKMALEAIARMQGRKKQGGAGKRRSRR